MTPRVTCSTDRARQAPLDEDFHIEHLRTRDCVMNSTEIMPFKTQNNAAGTIITSISQIRKWGTKRLGNLSLVTQLVSGGVGPEAT